MRMEGEQQALANVLADGFAVDRLRALGQRSLHAAALPALVLWLDGGVHVPAALVWLALVTWPACAALAAVSLALASRFRRSCEAGQPAARGLAGVHFAPGTPSAADAFAFLAGVLGGAIWLNAVAPSVVAAVAAHARALLA